MDPRPLPWVVAVGIHEASELGLVLARMGGTVTYVDQISKVRQEDYHFVVAEGSLTGTVAPHINVLQFLAERSTGSRSNLFDYRDGSVGLSVGPGARAERFEVGSGGVRRGLQQLIRQSIIANIPVGGDYGVLSVLMYYGTADLEPLVEEVSGKPLGAVRTAPGGASEWWVLPSMTTDRASWLRAAFAVWKASDASVFPPDSYGITERWMTHSEVEASAAVAAHQIETSEYLRCRMQELEGLKAEVEAQTAKADHAHRRLLTGQGEPLVDAVAEALRVLGFRVTDSDEEAEANKAAKREDLRLETDLDNNWLALLEVKGYSNRSAKTNDIAQLGRAVGFFESRTGRTPSAQWYVVNARFELPPDERPVPLASSPEDVQDFAEDGGLVVDTRELFQMVRLVESGKLTQHEAQAKMIAAVGTFEASADTSREGELNDDRLTEAGTEL